MDNRIRRCFFRIAVAVIFGLLCCAVPALAESDGEGNWQGWDDGEEPMPTIVSVGRRISGDDFLITVDEFGFQYDCVFHRDGTATPLYLDRDSLRAMLPDELPGRPEYTFGVLPNGDYYEQMQVGALEYGVIRILNRAGYQETLYVTPPDSGAETIVGAYGEKILVMHRVSGFTENRWTLYMIDHAGNKIGQMHELGDDAFLINKKFRDLGCGVFICGTNDLTWRVALFDTNSDSFYLHKFDVSFSPFWEDTRTALWCGDEGYEVSVDMLANEQALNAFGSGASFDRTVAERTGNDPDTPERDTIGEGLAYLKGEFCTYSGEHAFFLPDYGSSTKIAAVGRFQNGYAPLAILGADGYYYVTVLDRTGAPQYDPIKIKDHISFGFPGFFQDMMPEDDPYAADILSDDGYIYYHNDDHPYLITPAGEEIALPFFEYDEVKGMANGFLICREFLIKLDDPTRRITGVTYSFY